MKRRQDPMRGKVLGEYRLSKKLGGGTFGAVYRAEHMQTGAVYAIKILHPHILEDEDVVQRFCREAEALARISHPNVVQIHDFDEHEVYGFFLVMELIQGKSLARMIKRQKRLHPRLAYSLIGQLLSGLGEVHRQGVVHRDLKPTNVMITQVEDKLVLKLFDFGIAALQSSEVGLTQPGMMMGSARYMSPEQVKGGFKDIDARADLYACGLLLGKVLTGEYVFDGERPHEIFIAHLQNPPPTLNELFPEGQFSPTLEAVFAKSLEKEPDDRYSTAQDFLDALATAFPAVDKAERKLHDPLRDTHLGVYLPVQQVLDAAESRLRSLRQVPDEGGAIDPLDELLEMAEIETPGMLEQEEVSYHSELSAPSSNVSQVKEAIAKRRAAEASSEKLELTAASSQSTESSAQTLTMPGNELTTHLEVASGKETPVAPSEDEVSFSVMDLAAALDVADSDPELPRRRSLLNERAEISHSSGVLPSLKNAGGKEEPVERQSTTTQTRQMVVASAGTHRYVKAVEPFLAEPEKAVTSSDRFRALLDRSSRKQATGERLYVRTRRPLRTLSVLKNRRKALGARKRTAQEQRGRPATAYVQAQARSQPTSFVSRPPLEQPQPQRPHASMRSVFEDGRVTGSWSRLSRVEAEAKAPPSKTWMLIVAAIVVMALVGMWFGRRHAQLRKQERPHRLKQHVRRKVPLRTATHPRRLAPKSSPVRVVSAVQGARLCTPTVSRRLFRGHSAGVVGVATYRQGKFAVSIGLDRSLRFWRVSDAQPLHIVQLSAIPRSLALSEKMQLLVVGLSDGVVLFLDLEKRTILKNIQVHRGSVESVAFSKDGGWVASGGQDRVVRVWLANNIRVVRNLRGHRGTIRALAFSNDGRYVFSAADDRQIRVWRPRLGSLRRILRGYAVLSLALHPSLPLAVTADRQGSLQVWSLRNFRRLAVLPKLHRSGVKSLAFDESGSLLLSASEVGKTKLWQLLPSALPGRPPAMTLRRVLFGHRETVTQVKFLPKRKGVLSASMDQTLRFWRCQ